MRLTLDIRTTKYPLPDKFWRAVVAEQSNPHLLALRKEMARRLLRGTCEIPIGCSTINHEGKPWTSPEWPKDASGRMASDFRPKVELVVEGTAEELDQLNGIKDSVFTGRALRSLEARFRTWQPPRLTFRKDRE